MKALAKTEIVNNLKKMYGEYSYAVLVDFKGMNAEQTFALRGELRKAGDLRLRVVKNTFNRKATEGSDFAVNAHLFKGQCGLVFCNDLIDVSKVIDKFCFKDKCIGFIACLNKGELCSEDEIKELASLPSMEVLRTKLLYLLNSTGSSLVRALNEAVNNGRSCCDDK